MSNFGDVRSVKKLASELVLDHRMAEAGRSTGPYSASGKRDAEKTLMTVELGIRRERDLSAIPAGLHLNCDQSAMLLR